MAMVYENQEFPYFKADKRTEEMFKEIVTILDKWSVTKTAEPDDECNGIISTVYRLYETKDFGPELIVRVVHILAQYDDDQEKSNNLKEKFKILFDFWSSQVVPEMQKYFKRDNAAIRVNATVGLLSKLINSEIELHMSKDVDQLTKNKFTIVTTNVPNLLLINIYKHHKEKCGSLLKSQNIFIEPEKIKNEQVWKDLKDLVARDVKLNVFVDCTRGKLEDLGSILNFKEFNFILVASNEDQSQKLRRIFRKKKIIPNHVDLNYKWSDLTEESQTKLLQTKVTFQNNSEITLKELLADAINLELNQVQSDLDDFLSSMDNKLFNLLVEQHEIQINSDAEDDSKVKNFEILYQNRKFVNKGTGFKYEISQEKLIKINANNKYVLIADIAGSGKSWVVKNISKLIRQQYPTRWVTYVDLKQFIKEFKEQKLKTNFASFFIEKILKPKTEFEVEIFKKLYKNGKVSIIFDGFDEIAPDCADFVADLAQLFDQNDGNQLWIVTRDYFEVNLQQKLAISNTFKLDELTVEDGVNFIVDSWILKDFIIPNNFKTKDEFIDYKNSSPNLEKYQQKARQIVQKVTMTKNRSVGLPQLFSMIADGFKDDNNLVMDLRGAKIFTKFVNAMYTRWADHKGTIRKDASVQSQDYELKFKEIHQFCAIFSLFPELIEILFPDYDKSEWPETEIIAGGIINKIGSSYSFIHETFREFFIADFIFKNLKKPKIAPLLIQVLTIHKYGIIRMFLNDFIDSYSMLEKVQLELEKSVQKF